MATIKEKIEKIMEYTDATAKQLLNMSENELNSCYASIEVIEQENKALAYKGVHLKIGEDCGCGGCESAIAECMEEDELPYVIAEELLGFIKSVYALLEEARGGDEV